MLAMASSATTTTTTTMQTNPFPQTPPSSLKRRSASPLDCHSLQSSLKRVRLSRSPGEFRLQRDLECLAGWERVEAPPLNPHQHHHHHHHHHLQQTQQEHWRKGSARLVVEDSLRVIMTVGDENTSAFHPYNHHQQQHHQQTNQFRPVQTVAATGAPSKFWIQIPRMYPHRPPAVARMENVPWMRHVVIQDAPPRSAQESSYSPLDDGDLGMMEQQRSDASAYGMENVTDTCGSGTVVFQWSPVMHLGNLLDFLLESKHHQQQQQQQQQHSSSFPTSQTNTMGHKRRLSPSSTTTTHVARISPITATDTSMNSAFPNHSSFLEEHKMEEFGSQNRHHHYQSHQEQQHQQQQQSQPYMAAKHQNSYFAPNRFDMGYGRFTDNHLQQQQQHHANEMDVN